jgi:nucleotide-binding universal stress UspA family protein
MLVSQAAQLSVLGDEPAVIASQTQRDEQYVAGIAGALARNTTIATTHKVMRGNVVASITSRAREIGADLIVMTSHGRTGLSRSWLGSVADGVIRNSETPVLMLRPALAIPARVTPRDLYQRILVPLDSSSAAQQVLEPASDLARCNGARMVLLRVVRPVPLIAPDASLAFVYPTLIPDDRATALLVDEAKRDLDRIARGVARHAQVEVEQHVVVSDHVAQAVLDFARASGTDMIAMCTHGRGTSRLVIGSMADKVVRASGLPVLLYRPTPAQSSTLMDFAREEEISPLFATT